MVMILGVIAGFVALVHAGMFALNLSAENTIDKLTVHSAAVERSRKELEYKVTNQKVNPHLQASVDEAHRQLQARQRIMQWVEQSNADKKVELSSLLEGLGRQHVSGLWLSSIDIRSGGHELNLGGYTLNPALVPELLEKLNVEQAFTGREFRRVQLVEDDQYRGVLNFILTTKKPNVLESTGVVEITNK